MNLYFITLFLYIGMWYMLSTHRQTSVNRTSAVPEIKYPFASGNSAVSICRLGPRPRSCCWEPGVDLGSWVPASFLSVSCLRQTPWTQDYDFSAPKHAMSWCWEAGHWTSHSPDDTAHWRSCVAVTKNKAPWQQQKDVMPIGMVPAAAEASRVNPHYAL